MSDTPRTDEVASSPNWPWHIQDHARQLERQLNEALARWDAECQRNHQLMLACGFKDANRFGSALDRALQERDEARAKLKKLQEEATNK